MHDKVNYTRSDNQSNSVRKKFLQVSNDENFNIEQVCQ